MNVDRHCRAAARHDRGHERVLWQYDKAVVTSTIRLRYDEATISLQHAITLYEELTENNTTILCRTLPVASYRSRAVVVSYGCWHIPLGHIPDISPPRQFPISVYMVQDTSPSHRYCPPFYNIKQSTVNVYKIDGGSLDRLGSGVRFSALFKFSP